MVTSAVTVDVHGHLDVEHRSPTLTALGRALSGETTVLVLRTFEDTVAFTTPAGLNIPAKTVRGWSVQHGHARPLNESETVSYTHLTLPTILLV